MGRVLLYITFIFFSTYGIINAQELVEKENKPVEKTDFNIYITNWEPFTIHQKSMVEGISVDIWELVARRAGIKYKYIQDENFAEALRLIKKDNQGMIIATSSTKKREEYASFSKPFISFPISIATNVKQDFIIDLKELEGKTVAVGNNYTAHALLSKHYPKIKFVLVEDSIKALDLLAKGKVYAAADILPVLIYNMNKYNFTNLKISGTSEFRFDVKIMVNKYNQEIIPMVNKYIDTVTNDEKQEILNKWIYTKRITKTDYTIVLWILFTSVLIIGLMFYKQNELKRFQRKLKFQKEEFESIFKYSTDGIAITNLDTKFLDFNDSYQEITGYTRDELLKKNSLDFAVLEHKEKMKELLLKVIKNGHIENYQKESIVKDGKRIYLNMSISLLPDKKRLLIMIKDITSLKQMDEQSRLASMAEMIENIAHQWRQPLSVISSSVSGIILVKELGNNNKQKELEILNKVVDQTKYLSKTIDDFRNFIRDDKVFKDVKVSEVIDKTISLVESTLKSNYINVIKQTNEDLIIFANLNELQQSLINILNNAKDAMVQNTSTDDDRIIFIETKKIDENTLELNIIDTAKGISESILSKIFDPYFTTKHKSVGTGLGLFMVDKIIRERHGFSVSAYNTELEHSGKKYKGACFCIVFKKKE